MRKQGDERNPPQNPRFRRASQEVEQCLNWLERQLLNEFGELQHTVLTALERQELERFQFSLSRAKRLVVRRHHDDDARKFARQAARQAKFFKRTRFDAEARERFEEASRKLHERGELRSMVSRPREYPLCNLAGETTPFLIRLDPSESIDDLVAQYRCRGHPVELAEDEVSGSLDGKPFVVEQREAKRKISLDPPEWVKRLETRAARCSGALSEIEMIRENLKVRAGSSRPVT